MSDMTSAVAINLLDNLIGMIDDNQDNDYDSALRMAIDALKAQAERTHERTETHACDLISRQAAIDALGGNEPVGDPSKMDDDDVVKMWERIRIINIINKLPSAQQERKKGKWITNSTIINCSVCKHCSWTKSSFKDLVMSFNYCPNCGADMREPEDIPMEYFESGGR